MQHVGVISIADPSILLPHRVVERGWQHVVVDADDAQGALQKFQIVTITFICGLHFVLSRNYDN